MISVRELLYKIVENDIIMEEYFEIGMRSMGIYLLTVATNSVEVENITQQAANSDSFWNATNILVNVLIAIISAMIAWRVAKVNTNAKTLSYRVSMYPILDYKFQSKNGGVPLKEIKIMYNGAVLPNPCLVFLEITNTGNKGIENPPILISNNEEIEMIPLEIENVPKGFIWKIESENEYSCKISASLINSKQKLRASFFMSENPKNPLEFSCAMCDLSYHEVTGSIEKTKKTKSDFKVPYGAALGGIALLLIFLMQTELAYNLKMIFSRNFGVVDFGFDIYIIAIPIFAAILSWAIPRRFNALLMEHRLIGSGIAAIFFCTASILLYMILQNIFFSSFRIQIIIAVITIVLYSSVIHVIHIMKK